ncbi:MAG TPA: hypothetical protein VF339_11720 [Gammaproteobacteria bacterium]
MQHLIKRFQAAVAELVADGPIKERLALAFGRHLEDLVIPDLPEPLRERFEALHAALHRYEPIGREGRLKVSVRKMSFAEAATHAEAIVELYAEVVRNADRAEPLKVVHTEEKVPRYVRGR